MSQLGSLIISIVSRYYSCKSTVVVDHLVNWWNWSQFHTTWYDVDCWLLSMHLPATEDRTKQQSHCIGWWGA